MSLVFYAGHGLEVDGVNYLVKPANRFGGVELALWLEARLSGLPEGVSVEPERIEVRYQGAQEAVGRLFALAQALTNDYERFEALVEGSDAAGGGGEVTG